jgi:hypothetical protein
MANKNVFGKSRKPGNAYVEVTDFRTGWRYEVLKLYKSVEASKKDPYARAFCFVHGICDEYGDTYLREIPGVYPALEAAEAAIVKGAS